MEKHPKIGGQYRKKCCLPLFSYIFAFFLFYIKYIPLIFFTGMQILFLKQRCKRGGLQNENCHIRTRFRKLECVFAPSDYVKERKADC